MKTLTKSELQTRLNGFSWNVASLLQDITGTVSLASLKAMTSEYHSKAIILGATEEMVNAAMFRTCNNFNIDVDEVEA